MMKKNVLLLLIFCSFFFYGNAQESCTPHNHPANEIRSKGFMDAGGQIIANDFLITANTLNFAVNQIEANLWTEEGEIATLDVVFYDNDGTDPGEVIGEVTGIVPTSQEIIDIDEQDDFEIRKVIMDFPTNFDLEGTGTEPVKYWVQLIAYPSIPGKRVGWELNGVEVSGEGVKYSNPSVNYWMTNDTWDGVFALHGICTKTEGCHIPESVTATNIEPHEATITWDGNEDATGYILEYGLQGFEPGMGNGTVLEIPAGQVSEILTDLELVTQYDVYLKTICAEGESIYTVPLTFSTIDYYCEIQNFEIIEPISNVEFAGIENRSPSGLNEAPAHEYFLDIQADVEAGETYTIIVEGNTGGNYENGITAFFDWNQDGIFNNTNERYDLGILFNSTGEDGIQISAEITVPQNAKDGLTRMRLMKEFYANAYILEGCAWISYGQAEDYGILVGTLGVEDHPVDNVKIYPNPIQDIVNVQSYEPLTRIEIYNMMGQIVMKKEGNQMNEKIEVAHLDSGVYLVKVAIGGSSKTFKVIKE